MICATRNCPHPARWRVHAEATSHQGTGELRGRTACDTHLEEARRWASAAGTPDIEPIAGAPPPPEPDLALF